MAKFTRLRFAAALGGIVLLGSAAVILLLSSAMKPGMRMTLDLHTGAGTSIMDRVTQKILKGRVGLRSIEYLGGTRVRLDRLQLALGGPPEDAALVDKAELELQVPAMKLKGMLDIAPILATIIDHYLVGFHLVKGTQMRAMVLAPIGDLESFRSWDFSTDIGGQVLNWEPIPTLAPIPLHLESGKISFAHGTLALENIRVLQGASHFDLNIKAENIAKTNAEFKPSAVDAKLDMGELLRTKAEPAKKISDGGLKAHLDFQGPMQKPAVSGALSGAVHVPFLPLSAMSAQNTDHSIKVMLDNIEGNVKGGGSNENALAQIVGSVQNTVAMFHSVSRAFGYSSQSAQGMLMMLGSWGAPKFKQVLNLEHGVVNYGFGFPDEDHASAAGINILEFPYDHLGLEITFEGAVGGFKFDARNFLNGNVRSELGYDRNRKPRPYVYTFDGTTLSLDQLSQLAFGPDLAIHGRADVHAKGDSNSTHFIDMNGNGQGTIRDFSLDWHPTAASRPEAQAIANLMRRAVVPSVVVQYPQFGRGVSFAFDGRSSQYNITALVEIFPNLDLAGSVEYVFSPGYRSTVPAADAALHRIGYTQRLTARLKEDMGQAEVELAAQ